MASVYFGLGSHAAERVTETIMHYYAFAEAGMAELLAGSIPLTPEAIHRLIEVCKEAQADELILKPCIAELDQIKRLEEIISV